MKRQISTLLPSSTKMVVRSFLGFGFTVSGEPCGRLVKSVPSMGDRGSGSQGSLTEGVEVSTVATFRRNKERI